MYQLGDYHNPKIFQNQSECYMVGNFIFLEGFPCILQMYYLRYGSSKVMFMDSWTLSLISACIRNCVDTKGLTLGPLL